MRDYIGIEVFPEDTQPFRSIGLTGSRNKSVSYPFWVLAAVRKINRGK